MTPTSAPDWEGALWDAIGHLQTLIRIDTVNPPGNEMAVARYLDDVLRGAGIESTVYEPSRGRAAVVARVAGDGSARPVLLVAHMDTVAVEKEKWSQNPFGGELVDGYLYGRGAIDDKGMLVAHLHTMLLLQARIAAGGKRQTRDVIFVATSDEEGDGVWGIDWVLANVPVVRGAEFALNEGGRIRVEHGAPRYCAVQCAEKVAHVVTMRATGPAGHASVPRAGNAIVRLARAIARVADHEEPVVLGEVTRHFLAGLAAVWPDATVGRAMADVLGPDAERRRAGQSVLRAHPVLDAVLRNGVSPTGLSGGVRSNVLPTEAVATLNVRTLPDESLADVLARLRGAIDDPGVELSVVSAGTSAPASPTSSALYSALARAVAELSPSLPVVPYLSTGATDNAALRRAGIHAYGLLPFPLTAEDEGRMHGHDERLPVSALGYGLRLVHAAIRELTV